MSEGMLVAGSESAWGRRLPRVAAATLLLPAADLIIEGHWRIAGLAAVALVTVNKSPSGGIGDWVGRLAPSSLYAGTPAPPS